MPNGGKYGKEMFFVLAGTVLTSCATTYREKMYADVRQCKIITLTKHQDHAILTTWIWE
ncbi:hypothetical protein Holit_00322 [Hollandina sp. SP2]